MTSRMTHLLSLALSVSLAAGCGRYDVRRTLALAPDDWTTEGGSPARTNAVLDPDLRFPLTKVWTHSIPAGMLSQLLVRDSMLFAPMMQGELRVISANTGSSLGKITYAAPIMASPVLTEGLLIIPFSSGKESIVAADFWTGKARWSVSTGPIEAAPLVVNGRLLAATLSGTILALDPATGEEHWRSAPPAERRTTVRSSPAADSNRIYVASVDGTVTAYRLTDGSTEWTRVVGGNIFAGMLLVRDAVFAATTRGELLCLDAASGAIRWSVLAGGPIYAAPSTDGLRIFVGSSDGTAFAFDAATGARQWIHRAKSNVSATPLAVGASVLIGSFDRSLVAVTADSGREVWRWEAEGRVRVSPVAWRGLLFVITDDREITAFRGGRP